MTEIRVSGIRMRLGGRDVLRGVNLEAKPGEIVSIIGPSGCGKTTLFRCILGQYVPDHGRVFLNGQDVTRLRIEKRGIGVVYQDYALFPHMTVEQNIGFGLRVRRAPQDVTAKRVEELLDLVRLRDKAKEMPSRLSGGESQRVAIARALAVEPRVMLLDEAFTALDATTRAEVVHEMRGIIRRLNLTTLLITHDQEEAFLFAKRVVVLNEGKVITTGNPEQVMAYDHPFIHDFVKMVLFRRATVEQGGAGERFVRLAEGTRIPIAIAGVQPGDEVHVMVKKGPEKESVEVWPLEKA